MNILAIDTATEACSAALQRSDDAIFSVFEIAPRQHTRLLPDMMDRVLAESGLSRSMLSHCAFSNGPGAFTGIRIAASQAQGIGLALGIPLVPVSTLAVLAQTCFDRHPDNQVLVALDARMDEIYWARYRRDGHGLAVLKGEEHLSRIDDILLEQDDSYGAGHGWLETLSSRVVHRVDPSVLPDARSLLKLAGVAIEQGQIRDARRISINYLRNRVAEKAAS